MIVGSALWLAMVALSAGLTALARAHALRHDVLDHPGHRTSHQVATPRGGGVAVVIVFLLAVTVLWGLGRLPGSSYLALAGGGALVASVGYWDDHRSLPVAWRLPAQVVAALLAVVALQLWQPVMPWNGWLPGAWNGVLLTVLIVWMINLYNFMDGIDGLAGVEAITTALVLAAVALWHGGVDWVLLSLAAASAGFLLWNWPPARIFLGDVGSAFLGYEFAVLALDGASRGSTPLWVWGTLLGVFIVDASVTLLRRMLSGQRFWQAHRSHAYQILSRRWGSHRRVVLAVLAVNLLWLAPLALAGLIWPHYALVCLLLAWLPLLVMALKTGAGNELA